jgi:hypothetical protein
MNKSCLQSAVLAYTAAFAPNSSHALVEHYSHAAYQQLMRKSPTTRDEADLFTAGLLALLSSLYRNFRDYRLHLLGFAAIMEELTKNKNEKPLYYEQFWPFARDLVLESSCVVPGANDMMLEFCRKTRPLLRLQSTHSLTNVTQEPFGAEPRFWPFADSIYQSFALLRRCFWNRLCNIGTGNDNNPALQSVLSEVKVERNIEAKCDEMEAQFHFTNLWSDRDNTVVPRFLHRVCLLLLVILEDEAMWLILPSPRATAAATSVLNFLQGERLAITSAELLSTATPNQLRVAQFIPRSLCLVAFGLGDTKSVKCCFHLQRC